MTNYLIKDLIETSAIGRPSGKKIRRYKDLDPDEGVTRLTGREADKEMREYILERMKEIGCKIRIDKVGNNFGR